MPSTAFDFASLLPAGLPPPAARWTGLARYSFVGGNNDPEHVPVDGLIDAVNAVLRREGKTLATYGLASGPQGYRRLREFLTAKLKRDAGIGCGSRKQNAPGGQGIDGSHCNSFHATAFSSKVGTGLREENASKQEIRASVLIQSEPILL